jgi:hypothetical protein
MSFLGKEEVTIIYIFIPLLYLIINVAVSIFDIYIYICIYDDMISRRKLYWPKLSYYCGVSQEELTIVICRNPGFDPRRTS